MPVVRTPLESPSSQEFRLTEQFVAHLGYVGIALLLILGGLGLPVPEEAPILLAAVLSRNGKMVAPLALSTCLAGVLIGDFIVYFLGYYYGEKVLSLPLTRRLLTRAREAQIKGYFHRHGFKILILGRFAVGFRTAAYLTAGILKLPPLKLFITDLVAASLSTFLMFALGYFFAQQIESGIREAQQWFLVALGVGLVLWLSYRFYKGQRRAGLPVGPPVLFGDEPPLPPDDLRAHPEGGDPDEEPLIRKANPASSGQFARPKDAASAPAPEAATAASSDTNDSSRASAPTTSAEGVGPPHSAADGSAGPLHPDAEPLGLEPRRPTPELGLRPR
jgi:membrane protein DedA with SNARE-associated domain